MVVVIRTSPRNTMTTSRSEDRNESNHEYNFFLDKDIQKKLLSYDESTEEVLDHFRINSGLSRAAVAKSSSAKDDFSGWSAVTTFEVRQKRPDRAVKAPAAVVPREPPRWESNRPAKEINYTFKHYRDTRDFMNQYRLEHTYNFGPLGKDGAMVEIHTTRVLSHPSASLTDPNSRLSPPRLKSHSDSLVRPMTPLNGQRDTKILELAHRYKFAPNALRAAQEMGGGGDDSDTQSSRSRRGSAASQNGRRRSAGKTTSLQASKVPTLPQSPSGVGSGKQPRKGSPSSTGAPFFHGKTMKHLPSNGYAIDNQAVNSPVTKSQNSVVPVPNNGLKTMDLLSHSVTAVDSKGVDGVQQGAAKNGNLALLSTESSDPKPTSYNPRSPRPATEFNSSPIANTRSSSRTNVIIEIKIHPYPGENNNNAQNEPLSTEVPVRPPTPSDDKGEDSPVQPAPCDSENNVSKQAKPPELHIQNFPNFRPFTPVDNQNLLRKNSEIDQELFEKCYNTPRESEGDSASMHNTGENVEASQPKQVNSTKAKYIDASQPGDSATKSPDKSSMCLQSSGNMENSQVCRKDQTPVVSLKVSGSLPPLTKSMALYNHRLFEQMASKGRVYVNSIRQNKTNSCRKSVDKEACINGKSEHLGQASGTCVDSTYYDALKESDAESPAVGETGAEEEAYPPEWYHQQKLLAARNGSGVVAAVQHQAGSNRVVRVSQEGPAIVELSSEMLPTESRAAKLAYTKMWSPVAANLPVNNVLVEKSEMVKRYLFDVERFEHHRGGDRGLSAPETSGFRSSTVAIEHEKDRKRMKASGMLRAAGLSYDPFAQENTTAGSSVPSAAAGERSAHRKQPQNSRRSRAIYGKKDLYHRTLKETLSDPNMVRAKAEFIQPGLDTRGRDARHPPPTTPRLTNMSEMSWRKKLELLRQLPKPSQKYPSRNRKSRSKSMEDLVSLLHRGQASCASYKPDGKVKFPPKTDMKLQFLQRAELPGNHNNNNYNKPFATSRSTPWEAARKPECLDTFSDFFDPSVSADARFDKYLMEMERTNLNRGHPAAGAAAGMHGAAVPTPPHARTLSKSLSDYGVGGLSLEKRYNRGSKGGGWKVIPGIKEPHAHAHGGKVRATSLSGVPENSWPDMSGGLEGRTHHQPSV